MAETRDFLFEIGTEEMPSAPLNNAVKQLGRLVDQGLKDAGLAHGQVRVISSPRRLAALVADVALETEAIHEVKRGPAAQIAFDADGNPTRAAQGFARKFGLSAEELTRREDTDGREYVFAEKNIPARAAQPLLTELAESIIGGLEWPNYRSQRWGTTHATFVRPIRWIVCLLGSELIPVQYADVTSGTATRGHRVLAPGEHEVASADAYEQVLRDSFVMPADERERVIREGIAEVEHELGVRVDTPKKVFDEVVNLCEWPTVLVGHFDEEFLHVPHEIICESMLSNQRYFPTYDADGKLTRAFVIVSNADPAVSATVIDGNERVVRARLDDAKFFYEEDLKEPLEAYLPRLAEVTFQEKLGTVRQKADRMAAIAPVIAAHLGLDDAAQHLAAHAALLAKADLVTQAVVEFTSQQGVMGGYYAQAAGEPAEVSEAIRDQYRPRFAGDELPAGRVGFAVAIADKLDTICGMFAIEQPPTGSSDPFAVRRSAIGVIAMLREAGATGLVELIDAALAAYAEQGLAFDAEKVSADVVAFFRGRLETIARDEKVAPDTIAAVAAAGVVDPAEFLRRVHALETARQDQPELFDDLATAYARAAHLAKPELGDAVDESRLAEAEQGLLAAVDEAGRAVPERLDVGDYEGALASLAALREPIDAFFTDVLVMDEDEQLRDNRLRLLNRFADVFRDVADIGELARKK